VFDVNDEIFIRLKYRVGVPNTTFRCALIFNTQGVIAFASVEPTETVRSEPGVYQSVVRVPAHLLAESEYSLNVSIFASAGAKQHYVNLRNALNFQVYDSMTKPSARGDYTQNLLGIVRPMLQWDISAKQSN